MKRFFYAVIFFSVLSGCSETIEEEIELPVTLKGKVYASSEYGYQLPDELKGIEISIGEAPIASAETDEDGKYELNLTTGTYDIEVRKEGFGTNVYRGVKLVGGTLPTYANMSVYQKSSTKFSDIELVVDNYNLTITGKVAHNLPNEYYNPYVRMAVFFSDNPEVSSSNYKQVRLLSINVENSPDFNVGFYYDWGLFSTGSTVYAVAHGVASYDPGYTDFESNQTIYSSLGNIASNVASAQIP